jgi:hypothetical protein
VGGREGGRIDKRCMCRIRLDLYADVKNGGVKALLIFSCEARESKKRGKERKKH